MTDTTHFRFEGWTLARASGELTRGGNTQRLAPQPLAMLVELVDHPGEVVTRERLVQVLWPKGVVDFDNSLNAVVRKLRTVLGDDPDAPRYIETLPRIGYRFVGKMDAAGGEVVSAPPPEAELAPRKRPKAALPIAVLVAFFGAGVAILVGRKDPAPPPPLPPVAASAQPGTPYPRRTTNERAYDLYLQGMFNRSRRDINGADLAISNFEAALKADPYYADAWAGLAETLSGAALVMRTPVVPTYERARAAALKSVEIDNQLGHGYASLANIYLMYDRDFERTEKLLARARMLEPNYGRIWHTLGLMRAYQGRMPEALDAVRRARELEPTTLLYSANYGLMLYEARRYDEAIAHARLLLASQPRFDQARSLLIRALVATGDVKGALEQLPLIVNERPTVSDTGFVYAHAGRTAEARGEIERIERIGKEGYGVSFDIAVIQAALGDKAAACASLQRALEDHSLRLLWMRPEPSMDPLRAEPCFAEVDHRLYGN